MKTIGLIGGMTWESSAVYYRHINRQINERLGGVHSAKIQLCSVDYAPIVDMQKSGNWDGVAETVADIAQKLTEAGAACVLICCNTVHMVADAVQAKLSVPLLHIAAAAGQAIREKRLRKVAILGTKFTMDQGFFKDRLKQNFNLDVLTPEEPDKTFVHDAIYDEFCRGIFSESTKKSILGIIDKLAAQGAEGVILGCTELPMLIGPNDCGIPTFDTTLLHAAAAVEFSLN